MTAFVGMECTWPIVVLVAYSWALSGKARLVAEMHGVHAGAAYSATLVMVAMKIE